MDSTVVISFRGWKYQVFFYTNLFLFQAYHRLAKEYHPDKNPEAGEHVSVNKHENKNWCLEKWRDCLRLMPFEVAIPPAAMPVKIIYPAAGWIASYWPGKENKYDHEVNWHTVASEI